MNRLFDLLQFPPFLLLAGLLVYLFWLLVEALVRVLGELTPSGRRRRQQEQRQMQEQVEQMMQAIRALPPAPPSAPTPVWLRRLGKSLGHGVLAGLTALLLHSAWTAHQKLPGLQSRLGAIQLELQAQRQSSGWALPLEATADGRRLLEEEQRETFRRRFGVLCAAGLIILWALIGVDNRFLRKTTPGQENPDHE